MSTRTTPVDKPPKPAAPHPVHRDDYTHLERLEHLGLVHVESDEKGPVETLFTHDNDSVHKQKPIL